MVGSLAFGKDQHGETAADQFTGVAQRLSSARFTLRQWKRVEECGGQVILEAPRQPLAARVAFRKKVRLEKLLRHCRGDAAPPSSWKRGENHRHVHVALVIRGEDHRPFYVVQIV